MRAPVNNLLSHRNSEWAKTGTCTAGKSYVCSSSLSLVVYTDFPLAQIVGVWLAGGRVLRIQF